MRTTKLTRDGLRRLIMLEASRLAENERGADAADIVQALVDAFETRAGMMRGGHGYTYDFQDGDGDHDHRPGDRDRELGTAWDSIVSRAVQELIGSVTPIVEDVWRRLEDGEFE